MWRAQLKGSIQELRFVLKQTKEHHGVWQWVNTKMNDHAEMNRGTFFHLQHMTEQFETPSGVDVVFGDSQNTIHTIYSEGLSCERFEEILKEKVAFGKTLLREVHKDNTTRELPTDIVEARNTVKHIDDCP